MGFQASGPLLGAGAILLATVGLHSVPNTSEVFFPQLTRF